MMSYRWLMLAWRPQGILPAIIGAVAAVGAAKMASDQAKKAQRQNVEAAEEVNRENYEAQKEFAQHGIRWKVEDAKAAGLHPLFGAGLGGATYSPSAQAVMTQPDLSWSNAFGSMGQSLAGAASRMQTQGEKAMQAANLAVLESQVRKNDAEAAAVYSEMARREQEAAGRTFMPTPPYHPGYGQLNIPGQGNWSAGLGGGDLGAVIDTVPVKEGAVKYKADEVTSRDPNRLGDTAGQRPFDMPVTVTPYGLKMLMPQSQEVGETWSELPWYSKLAAMHNSAAAHDDGYWNWVGRYINERWLGRAPRYQSYPNKGGRGPSASGRIKY